MNCRCLTCVRGHLLVLREGHAIDKAGRDQDHGCRHDCDEHEECQGVWLQKAYIKGCVNCA